jgi:hypothetical protein
VFSFSFAFAFAFASVCGRLTLVAALASPGVRGAFAAASRRRLARNSRRISTGFVDRAGTRARRAAAAAVSRGRLASVAFACVSGRIQRARGGFSFVGAGDGDASIDAFFVTGVPSSSSGVLRDADTPATASRALVSVDPVASSFASSSVSPEPPERVRAGSSPRNTFVPGDFPGEGDTFGDTPPAMVIGDAGYTGWYTRGVGLTFVAGLTRGISASDGSAATMSSSTSLSNSSSL